MRLLTMMNYIAPFEIGKLVLFIIMVVCFPDALYS